MKRRGDFMPLGAIAVVLGLSLGIAGCSSVNQFDESDLQEFSTLTVAYQPTGPSPSPCDDALPVLDGVAQDVEWGSAEPLFLRLRGSDGSGGRDQSVEMRAVWTNESRFGGQDRVYFLIRYFDDDFNASADLLAYGTLDANGEVEPSPIPQADTTVTPPAPDPIILDPAAWTRLNPNGREDQVLLLVAEENAREAGPSLVDVNRSLMRAIGTDVPASFDYPGASDTDVWIWRATRTNGHPVPQLADWQNYQPGTARPEIGECDVPGPVFQRFDVRAGFFQDLWLDGSGNLVADQGTPPFVKNFVDRDPVPDRITQAVPSGRDPEDEGLVINCNLAKDLILWWPTSKNFRISDVIATSRVGQPRLWSQRLLPGDYDRIQGWAIQTPTGSAKDVRGKGVHEESTTKGFPVWTVELMRQLDTGNADDLLIEAGKVYRMVLGVFDFSGTVGSGSREIRVVFEAPDLTRTPPRPRC